MRNEAEKDIRERKQEYYQLENKLNQREANIDKRDANLINKENALEEKNELLNRRLKECDKKENVLQTKIDICAGSVSWMRPDSFTPVSSPPVSGQRIPRNIIAQCPHFDNKTRPSRDLPHRSGASKRFLIINRHYKSPSAAAPLFRHISGANRRRICRPTLRSAPTSHSGSVIS